MKINHQVHLIRKEFSVTQKVKRYVNIYLIMGKYCYLIDSGVAGTQNLIAQYLESIGRKLTDIKGIFLTHAHPDHIGAAAELKRQTNCEIYAPFEELPWIEDIQRQYLERPIPNFFELLSEPVKVSRPLKDGEKITLEEGIEIEAFYTKGHSHGSMSYLLNGEVIFSGDAIPVSYDLPIFVDYEQTLRSLDKLKNITGIQWCCPAWDDVYNGAKLEVVIENSKEMLFRLKNIIIQVEKEFGNSSETEKMLEICKRADMLNFLGNPFVVKSIEAGRMCE